MTCFITYNLIYRDLTKIIYLGYTEEINFNKHCCHYNINTKDSGVYYKYDGNTFFFETMKNDYNRCFKYDLKYFYFTDDIRFATVFNTTNNQFVSPVLYPNILFPITQNNICVRLNCKITDRLSYDDERKRDISNYRLFMETIIEECIHERIYERIYSPFDGCFSIKNPVTNLEKLYTDSYIITDIKIPLELIEYARNCVTSNKERRLHNLLNDQNMVDILSNDHIIDFVKSVFPEGSHVTTFSSVKLQKNDPVEGWHIDYPYHTMPKMIPLETLGLQLLIMLDDFTIENGATYICKGSHVSRTVPVSGYDNQRLTGKKGSVVFWLAKMWHCQGVNKTDLSRSALLANFGNLSVNQKHDMTLNSQSKRLFNKNKLLCIN